MWIASQSLPSSYQHHGEKGGVAYFAPWLSPGIPTREPSVMPISINFSMPASIEDSEPSFMRSFFEGPASLLTM